MDRITLCEQHSKYKALSSAAIQIQKLMDDLEFLEQELFDVTKDINISEPFRIMIKGFIDSKASYNLHCNYQTEINRLKKLKNSLTEVWLKEKKKIIFKNI